MQKPFVLFETLFRNKIVREEANNQMIVTKKYESFNRLKKSFFGKKILNSLFQLVARYIGKAHEGQFNGSILSTDEIISLLPADYPSFTYDVLYNTYSSQIDQQELATLINGFVTDVENRGKGIDLSVIRSYFFAFFFNYWCQFVEHTYKITSENNYLVYIGSKQDSEYRVFKAVLEKKFGNNTIIRNTKPLSAGILSALSDTLTGIKRKRESSLQNLLSKFSDSLTPFQVISDAGVIVIGILEERRFARIAQLYRELIASGHTVVLYSALHKRETLRGLKKYPELEASLVLDSSFITKSNAEEIIAREKDKLQLLYNSFQKEDSLKKYTYKGVPLFEIAWNEFHHVLLLRGMQAALDKHVINKLLEQFSVKAFIGLDNSVSTGVWMSICKQRSIPSFYHYYNASLLPVVYRLLVDSYQPTAWLLGGSRQLDLMRSIEGSNADNYHLTGDMFADTIVRCDKKSIRKEIRNRFKITDERKVIVLVSSYIIAAFTEESKRILFQTVATAASQLGMELLIKAHPNENLALLHSQMDSWDIKASVTQNDNIRDVFLCADIVCMYFSEAAQQAILVGVPVICIVPEEMLESFDRHWDYFSSGAVEYITFGNTVAPAIEKLVFEPESRNKLIQRAYTYAENLLGSCDGNNAARFSAVINSFVSKN